MGRCSLSQQLINRNLDLRRLRDEGYSVQILANHLVVSDVPYVTTERQIETGTLVSELTLAGDATRKPDTHVVLFSGKVPCDSAGHPLTSIVLSNRRREIVPGLEVNHQFSSKPADGYRDYHHKMTTYATLISGPAGKLDSGVTARKCRVIENVEDDSVFNYAETASVRAGITVLTQKLKCGPVGIIGLGGTGGYILDFLAKTPVEAIHLFDGDRFLQHNAFRDPGAPSRETLDMAPVKSAYFTDVYSNMRRNIFAHGYVTESTAHELQGMEFVFVAVDDGASRDGVLSRKYIVEKLRKFRVPFIDVGMGVLENEGSLIGQLRVTSCTDLDNDEILSRIPYEGVVDNDYSRNIQIAELNALNAALAVIKWKKTLGFYCDLDGENLSYYQIDGNSIINEHKS